MATTSQAHPEAQRAWEFWIDRGGTFTDIVARAPGGSIVTAKLLSENPGQYDDAAVAGIRHILGLGKDEPLPAARIAAVKLGTTVATNALLERKGAPTLLVTTKGFADQLRIGTQHRPKLFVRKIELPPQLYASVIEADERVLADGTIENALDEEALLAQLREAYAKGLRAAAIVFMHGYRFPEHEKRAAACARRAGFTQISVSHEISPLIRFIGRGDTSVADAYLSPVLRAYVERVASHLKGIPLYFMQSNGGLAHADHFRGRDAVLSGPAGGVVGHVETARAEGFEKLIGFDMGGTSTDVSHFAGAYERVQETTIAGVRLRVPMLSVNTVAAGGGSILVAEHGRLRAGPESAGAMPGPACYRNGGPLTVTDANLMTGRIHPGFFPALFGKSGTEKLDHAIVEEKFGELAARFGKPPEAMANGFLDIAVDNMAQAIRKISVARGYDVTEYTLSCFGGAGAQLACRVADALGMESIFIHRYAGVLSAFGIGHTGIRVQHDAAILAPLSPETEARAQEIAAELAARARADVAAQGASTDAITTLSTAHLRYEGTDTTLEVKLAAPAAMRAGFTALHRQRFGFSDETKPVFVESLSVEALSIPETKAAAGPALATTAKPLGATRLYAEGSWHEAPICDANSLSPGEMVAGPALITEPLSTIVIEPGWQAQRTHAGNLHLTRIAPRARAMVAHTADPVRVELFANLFMSIAEQMGLTLEKTASSVNIKERLDFSCAIYDHDGNLIANAPHMPVHLGSMGESVAAVRAGHPAMQAGDVFALNAPYAGGTHLPDVTVVMPVFDEAGQKILFYTAARGHHADIGGISPGSMPPFSRSVEEEGVLLDNVKIAGNGRFHEAELRALLTSGTWPSRNPDLNIADLKAQIAACQKGANELRAAASHFGLGVVQAYMGHVQDQAEAAVRAVIGRLADGAFTLTMDGGAKIAVRISVDRTSRSATIDFTGTSPQQKNNFNAPAPVAKAAVLYAFRCLVDADIPLNAGCLRPLSIIVPEGSMLKPHYPAAVVAGNVETSQALTDAIMAALNAMAASQGTMNNLTFGNARHQYYETICGGAGAGPGFDGESAIHTHMTNSRLTDPEILEFRFPVIVESFVIRRGSGGDGKWRGGDGVVRTLRFREAMTASILSTRRETAPFGLAGGSDAMQGLNHIRRADGSITPLKGADVADVAAGDAIIIATPGGGGYGALTPVSGEKP
ncbi:MAG TPA: hydantoinase B/oxoprolinase family protein [Micropepsaceae bacterium]|nr:hydantoinase B/oxoprolinase family protein [Micropepsaceae bacterium]